MENLTIPVTIESVVGIEGAVAEVGVVVVAAVVGVGVSEKEYVTCNKAFAIWIKYSITIWVIF